MTRNRSEFNHCTALVSRFQKSVVEFIANKNFHWLPDTCECLYAFFIDHYVLHEDQVSLSEAFMKKTR